MTKLDRLKVTECMQAAKEAMNAGNYLEAEEIIKSAIETVGEAANFYNLLGCVYHKQSRFIQALNAFRAANRANPLYLEASLNLTATLCDLGLYEQAQSAYQQIVSNPANKDPANNPSISGKMGNRHAESAQAYKRLDMHREAQEELNKALKLKPNMPDVRLSLARSYLEEERIQDAEKELEQLTLAHPSLAEGHLWMGILRHKQERLQHARKAWMRALECSPDMPLAKAYLSSSKKEISIKKLESSET